jgi:hypothetical protein
MSNIVGHLDAGVHFDAVLTFLALRWSLSVSRQETFSPAIQPQKIETYSSEAL